MPESLSSPMRSELGSFARNGDRSVAQRQRRRREDRGRRAGLALASAIAEELTARTVGGEGKTAEIEAAYFGGYVRPRQHPRASH